MAIKVLLYIVLLFICWLTIKTATLGRKATGRNHVHITRHRAYALRLFWTIVASVTSVELFVRSQGGRSVTDMLFYWHLGFAIAWVVSLVVLTFLFNGIKSWLHTWIAYPSLLLFVGTVATAIPIIWRLP